MLLGAQIVWMGSAEHVMICDPFIKIVNCSPGRERFDEQLLGNL